MKGQYRMTKTILRTIRSLAVATMLMASSLALPVATTYALGVGGGADAARGTDQQGGMGCLFGTESGCSGGGIFKTITDILLFIIGAISVIMLIIGGMRYTVSGGDQSAVTSAKNTILYAVVGLVVAILSYAVIHFVINSVKQS